MSDEDQEAKLIPDAADKDPLLLRLLYTLLFYVVFALSRFVVALLAIVQALFALISGEPQPDLRRFGAALGRYLQQIVAYISWASDDKPFPFADWPNEKKDF